jgi:cell division protein FtsI/penicillin-binding protein 2
MIGMASFVAGALIGGTSAAEESVRRFVEAWARNDFAAMHDEITDDAASRFPLQRFESLYIDAERTATLDTLEPGDPEGADSPSGQDAISVAVDVRTNAFGELRGYLVIPMDGDEIAWRPHLVFPGLTSGERLDRRTEVPKRAPILARGGTPLAQGPAARRSSPISNAAVNIAGELGVAKGPQAAELERRGFPDGVLVGRSGLEQAFETRLAGQPGGELLAVGRRRSRERRTLASSEPVKGKPVRTTIDPDLQEAAVLALGDLFGGVAVLDAKDGSVRALAGIAYSSPQPPGSAFKVVTTVAALEADVVELNDEFPVETSAVVGGREVSNAHDEPCGGTFTQSFAHSCNTVFAPLGVEVGNKALVQTAERFGFNAPPALFNAEATKILEPPPSTIPTSIGTDTDIGVSAIGQGEVLATPLEMASVSQTIAAGGTRSPTPLVTEPALAPDAGPVKVTSGGIAATVRDLMVGVVNQGTGTAAAIPGVEVAGKTGTAELGPAPVSKEGGGGEEEPPQDAWFTAFAPASNPKLAVAVMIVEAEGDGGTVAAPIAREVLEIAVR